MWHIRHNCAIFSFDDDDDDDKLIEWMNEYFTWKKNMTWNENIQNIQKKTMENKKAKIGYIFGT